jgi:DNA-binding CsgD family transcriptional regulator
MVVVAGLGVRGSRSCVVCLLSREARRVIDLAAALGLAFLPLDIADVLGDGVEVGGAVDFGGDFTFGVLVCDAEAPPVAPEPPVPVSAWDRLSPTQRDIAHLVGEALTNQQIATRVYLSPHTVNYHLRQIFKKLGIASRVELARIAQERSVASSAARPAVPAADRSSW